MHTGLPWLAVNESLQIIWPLELGPISGTEPNFVSIFNVFSEMLRNALSIFEAKHLKILFKQSCRPSSSRIFLTSRVKLRTVQRTTVNCTSAHRICCHCNYNAAWWMRLTIIPCSNRCNQHVQQDGNHWIPHPLRTPYTFLNSRSLWQQDHL